MLELLFRKEILNHVAEGGREYARLLKDKWKVFLKADLIVFLAICMPFSTLLACCISIEQTLFDVVVGAIFLIALGAGSIYFYKRFKNEIARFSEDIAINMYNKRYLRKGNALSSEDFKKIEESNKKLYYAITRLRAHGFCYSICFELLKTLKKGEMLFVAVYSGEPESKGKTYTMHVLYVNGDWCYDTYCEKQLPLEQVLKVSKGKIYKSYSYSDIEQQDYDDFKNKEAAMLKEWCANNDCYVKFKEN